jgi:hypothetical protein
LDLQPISNQQLAVSIRWFDCIENLKVIFNFRKIKRIQNLQILTNLEKYYGSSHVLIKDGLLFVTFGTITVHIQPFGPAMQHFQDRTSIRYWGQWLPAQIYNSPLGIAIYGLLECMLCFLAVFGTGNNNNMLLFFYCRKVTIW